MTKLPVASVLAAVSCLVALEAASQTPVRIPEIARWELAKQHFETVCQPLEENGVYLTAAQCYDEVVRMLSAPLPITPLVEPQPLRRVRSEAARSPDRPNVGPASRSACRDLRCGGFMLMGVGF